MSRGFWVLYLMFFIFVFPMIFEYVPVLLGGESMFGYTSPWWSITYLFVGSFGWVTFIVVYYFKMVYSGIKVSRGAKMTLRDGIIRTARIESKKILKEKHDDQLLELEISFKNLANVFIKMPYEVHDSAPEKRRFEVGKNVNIRINPDMGIPLIVLEGSWIGQSKGARSYTLGLAFLILFCIGYLVFSYWFQNNGMGWRFLHFWHPWVMIPYYGLFFGLLVGKFLFSEVMGVHSKKAILNRKILINGKLAMAKLRERKQTGLYINEQPQIRFEFEFRDVHGQDRVGSVKKIVDLLELHTTNVAELPIFYLPEDPSKVLLAEDYYVQENY